MPLDGTTYIETTTTEPSVEGLIAWLRTQDLTTEYEYCRTGDCLLHRYLRTIVEMRPNGGVGGWDWYGGDGVDHKLPHGLNKISVVKPHTYAAALKRAEEYSNV